jgi:alpha-aminoadipic semialdehyde synthase
MIGIRREDKNDWERRAPLTPDHVAQLVEGHGLRFAVQSSKRRIFANLDYEKAGAVPTDDLSACKMIVGIKEVPVEAILPEKVYLYFSHTTKGQAHNMPALRRLLELNCTLLDYEGIVDEHERRLVFFGKHAGYAGMIDALWALGKRLAAEGEITVFDQIRLAHDYSGLDEATHHVSRLGEKLRHTGLPHPLRPIVFGFTGSGNVSQGAQEILDRMPTQELLPTELVEAMADPDRPRNIIYKVRFRREDRVERIDGGAVDLHEFAEHPERYRSAIPRWLPHLSVLVHGSFWDPAHPRIVGVDDLAALWAAAERPKLRLIADISCDIGGGIEATVESTEPGNPVYVYDVDKGGIRHGVEGRGPVILAVDNLPCQLPIEASEHFGDGLARFLPALARCDFKRPFEELALPDELLRAIVVHGGRLTPAFSYLERSLG